MYAFVHIEKTAGTTLNAILRRSFGTRHCDIRLPLSSCRDDCRDHREFVEAADLQRTALVSQPPRNRRSQRKTLLRFVRGVSRNPILHPAARSIVPVSLTLSESRPGHTQRSVRTLDCSAWIHNWQTKMIAGEPNAQKAIDLISSRFGFVGLTERFDESLLLLRQWLREPAFKRSTGHSTASAISSVPAMRIARRAI